MTHKQKVLRLLSDHKPHSHHELYALGCVAHSRVSDLRRDGYEIEQWREGDLYLYRLVGALNEAAVEQTPPAASLSASSIPAEPLENAARDGALNNREGNNGGECVASHAATASSEIGTGALPSPVAPPAPLTLFANQRGAYGDDTA